MICRPVSFTVQGGFSKGKHTAMEIIKVTEKWYISAESLEEETL